MLSKRFHGNLNLEIDCYLRENKNILLSSVSIYGLSMTISKKQSFSNYRFSESDIGLKNKKFLINIFLLIDL